MYNMLTESTIDFDASTREEALDYLRYRNLQLLKFGIKHLYDIFYLDSIVSIFDNSYCAIYVLKPYRGNQIFIKRLQQIMLPVITLEDCKIAEYLNKIKCNHIELKHSNAYKLIQSIYGDNHSKRSKVPFIYHIDEGGYILEQLGASDIVKDAYYLHPVFQDDSEFIKNKSNFFDGIAIESLLLAVEYRNIANRYLSSNLSDMNDIEKIRLEMVPEIRLMLIADKVQNYKDFMLYHQEHIKYDTLYAYFHQWFKILDIDINKYLEKDTILL